MGSDKAFLRLGGRSLLDRALELARSVSPQVKIAGNHAKFALFAPVVEDIYPGQGPLAGIHAALSSSETDLNLVVGIDLPFLNPALLKYLIREADTHGATVTVVWANGHYQTLCAVYRKEFGPVAQTALQNGNNKIDALFRHVSLRVIQEDELASAGFHASIFRNVNTPDDWQEAQQEFASSERHV